jgi:hypothetical protein
VISSGRGASRKRKVPEPGILPGRFGSTKRVLLENRAAWPSAFRVGRAISSCKASRMAVYSVIWRCGSATNASRSSRLKEVRSSGEIMARQHRPERWKLQGQPLINYRRLGCATRWCSYISRILGFYSRAIVPRSEGTARGGDSLKTGARPSAPESSGAAPRGAGLFGQTFAGSCEYLVALF